MKKTPITYIIGVDLGGTKIRAGIFRSSDYKLIKKITVPTGAKDGKKNIISNLELAIKKIWRKNTVSIGLGVAGIVDTTRGIFLSGPNLPKEFHNVPLGKILKKSFGVSVRVENDARCFTLAEALRGAGKKCDSVFGITLGTGVGGGLYRDRGLVRGQNAAGEIGHLPVADELPGHPLGKTIDLESAASGKGLEKTYAELSGNHRCAEDIESLYRKHDAYAKRTFEIGRHALLKGLASIQLIFDPECIVIGGGLGRSTIYWKPAVSRITSMSFPSLKRINVKSSALGENAGMLGAALLYEL